MCLVTHKVNVSIQRIQADKEPAWIPNNTIRSIRSILHKITHKSLASILQRKHTRPGHGTAKKRKPDLASTS